MKITYSTVAYLLVYPQGLLRFFLSLDYSKKTLWVLEGYKKIVTSPCGFSTYASGLIQDLFTLL
jgi:hypothetical protein